MDIQPVLNAIRLLDLSLPLRPLLESAAFHSYASLNHLILTLQHFVLHYFRLQNNLRNILLFCHYIYSMSTAYSMGFMRRRDMALKYFETESINHFFNCNLHFFCFPNPFPFNAKQVDDYRILWDQAYWKCCQFGDMVFSRLAPRMEGQISVRRSCYY